MTFIIAEAGINHGGDIQEAMRLVVAAKRCGADVAKFQHFNSQILWGDERIKHLELSDDQIVMLYEQSKMLGIEFMCTAFDAITLKFLLPMLKRIKIASGCVTDKELLGVAADSGLPVILSTGMCNIDDIDDAFDILEDVVDLTMLQCTSVYPCPPEQVNLSFMQKMGMIYERPFGLSDHTNGIHIAIAAAALDAYVIEKHLTLDRNAEGPDHKASIEPQEFKAMVSAIRDIEQALGDGVKTIEDGEHNLRRIWRDRR